MVNRIGFGALHITGRDSWGEPDDRGASHALLRRVVEIGINFIDTADSYGPGVSERLIAEALKPYESGLVIATKGGFVRPAPNRWDLDGRPEQLRAACEGSLQRLGVNTIDLYYLHHPDPEVPFEESIGSLIDLRNEGKIRLIGVSNVSASQLRVALDMTDIASVQNFYNFNNREAEPVLELCEEKGIAFIAYGPLNLRGKDRGLAGKELVLRELAVRHDVTPAQIALAWLLKRSPAIVPIPGTSSIAHLDENIAAAEVELDSDEFDVLAS